MDDDLQRMLCDAFRDEDLRQVLADKLEDLDRSAEAQAARDLTHPIRSQNGFVEALPNAQEADALAASIWSEQEPVGFPVGPRGRVVGERAEAGDVVALNLQGGASEIWNFTDGDRDQLMPAMSEIELREFISDWIWMERNRYQEASQE